MGDLDASPREDGGELLPQPVGSAAPETAGSAAPEAAAAAAEQPVSADGGNGEDAQPADDGADSAPAPAPAPAAAARPSDDPIIEDVPEGEAEVGAAATFCHAARSPSSSDDESSSQARRRHLAPVRAQEPTEAKELDEEARDNIIALHGKGKNPAQIKNNYLLVDYALTEEAILGVIRERIGSTTKTAPTNAGAATQAEDSAPKSYSPQELKDWLAAVKNKDSRSMQVQLQKHPALLSAGQPGIGNTALHWAALLDYTYELRFLLRSKADVNLRNATGSTALHTAANNGKVDALTVLLEAGADMEATDDDGNTALDVATRREEATRQKLEQGGGKSNGPPHNGLQPQAVEEAELFLRQLDEVHEVLELFALTVKLRAEQAQLLAERPSWTTSNLNLVLTLANLPPPPLPVEKDELAKRVEDYLERLSKAECPLRRPRAHDAPEEGKAAGRPPASREGAAPVPGAAGTGEKKMDDKVVERVRAQERASEGRGVGE
jgi:hypothetical protein